MVRISNTPTPPFPRKHFLAEAGAGIRIEALSLWESASFDFVSLRSGRTGAIVPGFLTIDAGRVDTVPVASTDLYGRY